MSASSRPPAGSRLEDCRRLLEWFLKGGSASRNEWERCESAPDGKQPIDLAQRVYDLRKFWEADIRTQPLRPGSQIKVYWLTNPYTVRRAPLNQVESRSGLRVAGPPPGTVTIHTSEGPRLYQLVEPEPVSDQLHLSRPPRCAIYGWDGEE